MQSTTDQTWITQPAPLPTPNEIARLAERLRRLPLRTGGESAGGDRLRQRATRLAKEIAATADEAAIIHRRSRDAGIATDAERLPFPVDALIEPLQEAATDCDFAAANSCQGAPLLVEAEQVVSLWTAELRWWWTVELVAIEIAMAVSALFESADLTPGRLETLVERIQRRSTELTHALPRSITPISGGFGGDARLMQTPVWRRSALTALLLARGVQQAGGWSRRRQSAVILGGALQDIGLVHVDRWSARRSASRPPSGRDRWTARHPELGAAAVAQQRTAGGDLPPIIAAHHRLESAARPGSPLWNNRAAKMVVVVARFTELIQAYEPALGEVAPDRHWAYGVVWRLRHEAERDRLDPAMTREFLSLLDPGLLDHMGLLPPAADRNLLRVELLPDVRPGWLADGTSWRFDLRNSVELTPSSRFPVRQTASVAAMAEGEAR